MARAKTGFQAGTETDEASVRRVRDAFAGPATALRRRAERFTRWKVRREARALGRLMGLLGPGPRLDVACGTGPLAATLAQGQVLVGVDASPEMVAGVGPGSGYAAVLAADAVRLPFRRGAFASGFVIRLLHHLDATGRRAVLAEVRRVVHGPVVVSVFDARTLEALRAARRRRRRGSRRAVPLPRFVEDAEAAGWEMGAVSRKLWRFTENVYVLLLPRPEPGVVGTVASAAPAAAARA